MGERKGTNKWYPPDFDPAKHHSLNGYWGVHALRERARKLDRGIMIIRFEMPFNIWCNGCGNHIGMGVRYNSEKTKVGMYHSTPIWKFRMKCHLCPNRIEIQTDPAKQEYVVVAGARRFEGRWDMEQNEQVLSGDGVVGEKLRKDKMFAVDHERADQTKLDKLAPTLAELERLRAPNRDDFRLNQQARTVFRQQRKKILAAKVRDDDLKKKFSLSDDLHLVDETERDRRLAKSIVALKETDVEKQRKRVRSELKFGSIFDDVPSESSESCHSEKKREKLEKNDDDEMVKKEKENDEEKKEKIEENQQEIVEETWQSSDPSDPSAPWAAQVARSSTTSKSSSKTGKKVEDKKLERKTIMGLPSGSRNPSLERRAQIERSARLGHMRRHLLINSLSKSRLKGGKNKLAGFSYPF